MIMKIFSAVIFIAITILVTTSCKTGKEVLRNQEQKPVEVVNNMNELSVLPLPFTIDTAWMDHLILNVVVSYTGKKKGIDFKLVWNGAWLKSYPPKAMVFLEPIVSSPSAGNKKIKQTMSFDITPLKASNPEFIVLLRDYKQTFSFE